LSKSSLDHRATVAGTGFEVDENFLGHGIGSFLHQYPQVHHKVRRDDPEIILRPGMSFTIEPILTMCKTGGNLALGQDKFSVVSPGIPSSQWEHIVLITKDGCEILTLREDEKSPLQ